MFGIYYIVLFFLNCAKTMKRILCTVERILAVFFYGGFMPDNNVVCV